MFLRNLHAKVGESDLIDIVGEKGLLGIKVLRYDKIYLDIENNWRNVFLIPFGGRKSYRYHKFYKLELLNDKTLYGM